MKYWWVNHKQTFKKELEGSYIWSPTKNKNGSFNQTYENLTLVRIGDVLFSYSNTLIKAIGIVSANYEKASIPLEFGVIGQQWNNDGYLVKIEWKLLESPFKPKDYIHDIKDLLPSKYAPIQKTGNGNQGVYLAEISYELGEKLISLSKANNEFLISDIEDIKTNLEEKIEQSKIESEHISQTHKEQLIKARVGQGIFKTNVGKIEGGCRITGITNTSFLIASHIKPWCESDNHERLDGNNGLLLSPHIDRLFDRGLISFSDEGDILVKQGDVEEIIKKWKIDIKNVGKFNNEQRVYLAYHRKKSKF